MGSPAARLLRRLGIGPSPTTSGNGESPSGHGGSPSGDGGSPEETSPPVYPVLVLLYDIRGYSTAARRIDEAPFGRFVAEAHQVVLNALAVRPPTFIKNLGDGQLVIWEHPDEALLVAVVTAALDALLEYRAFAARQSFAGVEHLPRDLGIGISAGPVQKREDYYGHTVNLAARLQDCARPRGVAIDDATFARIPPDRRAWNQPTRAERAKLKGVGRVDYHWIARLTRREIAARATRRWARRLAVVLVPLLMFLWVDGELPFPAGARVRGAIDAAGISVLRPYADLAVLDAAAVAMRGEALDELRRRVDPASGRAFPGVDAVPDFFAWTDGAALATLLLEPAEPDWAARCIEQLFSGAPSADGAPLVEFIPGEGWWRHPTERSPHFESTVWVLLGLVRACADPGLDSPQLRARVRAAFGAFRAYFDPQCGAWHWQLHQAPTDVYGNPEPGNEHYASVYNTVMAIWVLTEAERLGVDEARDSDLLKRSVAWMLDHYIDEARGWSAESYPPTSETLNDYRDGLTYQAFWVLMHVEAHAPQAGPMPPRLVADTHTRLLDLLDRGINHPDDRHKWVVTRFPRAEDLAQYRAGDRSAARRMVRVRDTVDFFWIPWGYAAARAHLRLHARTQRETVETLRVLTHMTRLAQQDLAIARGSWIFRLYELANALSEAPRDPAAP